MLLSKHTGIAEERAARGNHRRNDGAGSTFGGLTNRLLQIQARHHNGHSLKRRQWVNGRIMLVRILVRQSGR